MEESVSRIIYQSSIKFSADYKEEVMIKYFAADCALSRRSPLLRDCDGATEVKKF